MTDTEVKDNIKSNKFKSNTVLMIIIAVIAVGYAFFFLSPRLFVPSEESLLYTETKTPVTINSNHKVTIENWLYSPQSKEMQVILSFDNTAIDASEKYIFQAVARNAVKESTEINYDVTYESTNFVNLVLSDIPSDFVEVALYVGYTADKDTVLNNGNTDEKDAAYTTVYTNKYKVSTADKIEPLSAVEMYINKLDDEVKNYESDINDLNKQISDVEDSQKDILTKVDQLNKDKEYMTVNEAKKVDEQISAYEASYKIYTEKINDYKDSISEIEDDIDTAKSKISELKTILKEKGSTKN